MATLRDLFADTTALRTPAFRRLWLANIVTVVGAQLTVVAVPAQIYAMTESSAYVGLTGVFGLVPLVVFGLWGGALADHLDRRLILVVSTAGLILTSAAFWLQAALGNPDVWLLLGLFALQQAFFAINQPARTAILPALLPAEQLAAATALNMTVTVAGAIAGPLLAGVLIPLIGIPWLYFIDAITLLATWAAVVRLPKLPPAGSSDAAGLRSVLAGFSYLRGNVVLLMSFAVDLVAMIFGMPRALFPEIAHLSFGGPAAGGSELAWLYAAIPVGSLIGGVFSGWVSRVVRQGRAVVLAILIWGFAITGFGLAAGAAPGGLWLVLALVSLAIGGAADMISAAFRQAMLLGAADDAVRGRLQGVFIVVVAGGPRLADVLHGYAGDVFGAAQATTAGGLAVLGLTIALSLAAPAFWRYRLGRLTPERP